MKRSKVYLSREQSRRIDQIAIADGTTGISLMENAGRSCVNQLVERGIQSAVICCGSGNNGGDGFVMARRLAIMGLAVKTILCVEPDKIQGDALTNYKIAASLDLDIVNFDEDWSDERLQNELDSVHGQPTDWIIDCLLGTGASGDPRTPLDRVIRAANKSPAKRMAVDVPSGLDCDTGVAGDPTIEADFTCTFVARKTGFEVDSAKPFLGEVQVVTIGISVEQIERVLSDS